MNFFDVADIYGGQGRSEEFLGRAMKGHRQQIVLTTKFGNRMVEGPMGNGGSRRYIMQAVEASLRRLDTDYIDLYQVHVPDPNVPQDETMRALDDLVRAGTVRYIGCSNYEGWRIGDAAWTARHMHLAPLTSAENQYSLLDRRVEAEVIPAALHYGVGFIPYAPLARGMLTGKTSAGQHPRRAHASRRRRRHGPCWSTATSTSSISSPCTPRSTDTRYWSLRWGGWPGSRL